MGHALSQGAEHTDLPSEEVMDKQLAHLEQINKQIRDINAHRIVLTSFRPLNFVKHEEDTRIHDAVLSSEAKYYNENYHAGGHPIYQDSNEYWAHHEGGRSKYKKRSVWSN